MWTLGEMERTRAARRGHFFFGQYPADSLHRAMKKQAGLDGSMVRTGTEPIPKTILNTAFWNAALRMPHHALRMRQRAERLRSHCGQSL